MIKKIFSLFAAILFAGSMMAATATLPVDYSFDDGKGSLPDGVTQNGLGNDYAASNAPYRLKFDNNNDYLQIQVDAAADVITIGVKQFSSSNSTIKIQGSADGSSFTDIQTFTLNVGQNKTKEFSTTNSIASTYRYFRVTRTSGSNFGLGTLVITKAATSCTNTVTITKGAETNGTYSLSATEICGDGDGEDVTISDITPAEGYAFDEITTSASGTVDNVNKKVTGITANTTITVKFKALTSYTVTWDNNGETSTSQVYEGSKPSFPATPESCDATSTTFIGWATEPWAGKIASLGDKTVYTSAEEMPAVTAALTYYAVFARVSGSASNLFSWEGGSSADLAEQDGVEELSADGSDYAAANAPYLVKWNGTGKYIIISVASQPGKVSAGFKMIGGNNTSTITVQEANAANGTFTDVENLAISGETNDEVDIETTKAFKSTTRAIKLYYTKGSNVGLGPISIEGIESRSDFMTTCAAAGQCEIPTFSVAGGTYNEAKSVELDCATEEATIYYTIDGTTPTSASTEYTKAINVAANMTIKAIAVKEGNTDSEVAEAAYTFETATPTITGDESAIISGNYFVDAIEVTLAREGEGEIYYTTDGKTPTAASEHYTGPFWLDKTTTVKAIVIREPWTSGAVAEKEYKYFAVVDCATARIAALSVSENNEVYKEGEVDVFTIRGYVTNMENYSKSNYFWIADEQGTSKVLEVYRPSQKGTGDLALNQAVEVTGKLTKYNTTPEFASGCTFEILADGITTSVDNTVDGKKAVKFIENGQLFIELNGHVYNVQGQIIK